jgi:hypothetical protein
VRTGTQDQANILVQPLNVERFDPVDARSQPTVGRFSGARRNRSTRRFSTSATAMPCWTSQVPRRSTVQSFRQNSSTANNINTIVGPRVMRFGVRVNF